MKKPLIYIIFLVIILIIIGFLVYNSLYKCYFVKDSGIGESCWTKFAVDKKDVSICDKIKDFQLINNCYIEIAQEKGDITICDTFYDKAVKDYPGEIASGDTGIKDGCYQFVADSTKDSSICAKIQREDFRNNCYSIVK